MDGAGNGLYDPKEVEVRFMQNPDVAPDGWYRGDFTAEEIAVEMKASENPEK